MHGIIRFAIGNVGSLKPGVKGLPRRCAEFDVKFDGAGLDYVMVQETRLQVKGVANTGCCSLFRSPATLAGLDGTHVWAHRQRASRVRSSLKKVTRRA